MAKSYKESQENPSKTLRDGLSFSGQEKIKKEHIPSAVNFPGFEKMKRLEEKASCDFKIMKPGQPDDGESFKVRKGKVEGYIY